MDTLLPLKQDNTETCVLHCIPEMLSGIELQLPTVVTGLTVHPHWPPSLPVSFSSPLSLFSEVIIQINYLYSITCSHYQFLRKSKLRQSLALHNSQCIHSCAFLGTSISQCTMAASFEHCNYHHAAEEATLCPTDLKKTSVGPFPGPLCSPCPLPVPGGRNGTTVPLLPRSVAPSLYSFYLYQEELVEPERNNLAIF